MKVNEHRANIVAEIGNGSPILALSGHMDVVDAEIKIIGLIPLSTHRKSWQIIRSRHNGYERRSDGFGHHTHKIKEQNQLPQGTIRLLATAGEEKEQEDLDTG